MEFSPVPGQVAHFSINVDDMSRAQAFYESVLGWKFHAYGPPGFFMVEATPPSSIPAPTLGSMQSRRELVPGVTMRGCECTFAVADIDATIKNIERLGGKIVTAKCTLPSIGHLTFFEDPEGNILGAMQYDSKAE